MIRWPARSLPRFSSPCPRAIPVGAKRNTGHHQHLARCLRAGTCLHASRRDDHDEIACLRAAATAAAAGASARVAFTAPWPRRPLPAWLHSRRICQALPDPHRCRVQGPTSSRTHPARSPHVVPAASQPASRGGGFYQTSCRTTAQRSQRACPLDISTWRWDALDWAYLH